MFSDLCYQDANDNTQLVQRAEGAPQVSRGDLAHIHGHEAGGEAGIKADHETAND